MGEVTPGPPLLQAGLLSSAPGEAAWSLLGALWGVEGAGEAAGTPSPAVVVVLVLEPLGLVLGLGGCSALLSFLASGSAGTGMI